MENESVSTVENVQESAEGFEWLHDTCQRLNLGEQAEKELLAAIQKETVPRNAYDLLLEELIGEKVNAVTDALTELPNFMILERDPDLSFDNRNLEVGDDRRSPEGKSRMCFAMCDLDGFKKVNDTEGHLAGNERLIRVANVIYGVIRKDDVALRFGGDEFGIVFKNTDDISSIIGRLEEIRTRIEGLNMGITMSVGVASSKDFDTHKDLFKAADDALYESKNTGRNKVTVYNSEETN